MALEPGAQFGRYRIERELGRGGMGRVFVARDLQLGREVALKVINEEYADRPEFVSRFEREAAVLARLDSPHVITIHDHGVHDGVPYLVTQLVSGGDLGSWLKREGPLSPARALALVAQVASGLADAHRSGVIHRDIKPANVLIRDPSATELHGYLCDFGIAASDSDTAITLPGAVAGTWEYLSPERTDGRVATVASDIYALGCLLWAAVDGRAPYTGSAASVMMAHLHAEPPQLAGSTPDERTINRVIRRAMAKDPEQRYATAEEFRADLLAPGSSAPTRGHRSSRRRIRLYAAMASGAVLVAVGAVLVVVRPWQQDTNTAAPAVAGAAATAAPGNKAASSPPGKVEFDLDGNGYSDVVGLEDFERVVFASNGSAFEKHTSPKSQGTFLTVWADVDRDGASEEVSLEVVPGKSRYFLVVTEFNGTVAERTRISKAAWGWSHDDMSDSQLVAGDFDNDRWVDLAVLHRTSRSETRLGVFWGRPKGFSPLRDAGVVPNADPTAVGLAVGDGDRDGDDDILMAAPVRPFAAERWSDTYRGPVGHQLLTADGREFRFDLPRVTAPLVDIGVSAIDDFLNTGGISASTVVVRSGELQLRLFEFDGSRFVTRGVPQTYPWTGPDLTALQSDAGVAAPRTTRGDVNGDGDIDVVFAFGAQQDRDAKVWVMLNHDGTFEAPKAWGTLTCNVGLCFSMLDDQRH